MNERPSLNMEVLVYSQQYKLPTLSLLKALWTSLSDEQADDYFNWRYANNPYSKSPLIVICMHEGRVIGVLGHMVQKFIINGKVENACIPVDGIVLPEYRRFGVYARMLDAGVELLTSLMPVYDFKMHFNASSNIKSAIGLVNLGWRLLGPKMYMTKISLFNAMRTSPVQGFVSVKFSKARCEYLLEVTDEIRYDDIRLVGAKHESPIRVLHDMEFYAWRYSYPPDHYQFVYLYKDAVPVSYMVISKGSKYQYAIQEYGCENPAALSLLIARLVKHLNVIVFRLFYLYQAKGERRTFARAGFVTEPLWLLKLFKKSRSLVYLRCMKQNGTEADYVMNGINALDKQNWKIFPADIL